MAMALVTRMSRDLVLLVVGLVLLAGSFVPDLAWQVRVGLQTLGATLILYVALLRLRARLAEMRTLTAAGHMRDLLESDGVPSYFATADGDILYRNIAAQEESAQERHLADALSDHFASPEVVLFRLQSRAASDGFAREVISTRRGQIRISVNEVGENLFVWRVDLDASSSGNRTQVAVPFPMITATSSGTILFSNDAFRRQIGTKVRHLEKAFADLPLVSGHVHELLTVNGPVKTRIVVNHGVAGRQEIYVLPDESMANATSMLGMWHAVEDLPVPLLKIAPNGKLLAANREARDLVAVDIIEETRLSDILEGLGRPIADWLRDIAEKRTTVSREFLRGRGERQEFFVQVTLNAAGSDEDRYLVAVLNDMTQFKSLEAQFVQSQKMQAIGQLAGGVAHDFNNLLTAISGHCDLLLLRHDEADAEYPDLVQIHQNANRAASLVGQLLAFSRKQNLRPEVLDLRDTLADLTHLLNRLVGEKVRLTLQHDPDLKTIRADKRQLEQVIMNLVVNARDAMPAGGEVILQTDNLTLADPVVRDRARVPAGDYVSVRVIDEGHGIPPDKLPKIFEPFFTTKRTGEGTGLGLSTAYGIVKQTGGFIFAESEVGVGSVFTLLLPVHIATRNDAKEDEPEPRRAERRSSISGEIVLLVEDETAVRAFASRALQMRGYTVIEADSAETALDLLSDPELIVDIFVSDVIMPGQDGPTWVREALKSRPGTPVVFVSGYAEDAFSSDQEPMPNSVFLPKPFSLVDLISTVAKSLGHGAADGPPAGGSAEV